MIINDLDGYYIVFDTKNWNTELDTLFFLLSYLRSWFFLTLCLYKLEIITLSLFLSSVSETSTAIALAWCRRARGESAATVARPAAEWTAHAAAVAPEDITSSASEAAVSETTAVVSETTVVALSLIHIWRCRRLLTCRSRWSPYH